MNEYGTVVECYWREKLK